VKFLENNR